MELQKHICMIFLFLFSLLSGSQAFTFYVGENDGWVLYPSENYNNWAERNRFQVNDIVGKSISNAKKINFILTYTVSVWLLASFELLNWFLFVCVCVCVGSF